jgi:hypothetical protein
MIKLENLVLPSTAQWEAIIRGMRNPMNSWDKSDSYKTKIVDPETLNEADFEFFIGEKDHTLMMKLDNAGKDHRKFTRMIPVYVDITAPLYWWKEFDTYKVGTVANSCSTMHKITDKEFTPEDFSCEDLDWLFKVGLKQTILELNLARNTYLYGGELIDEWGKTESIEPKNKKIWRQIIQALPSSYNQRRTIFLNYEVLANMYHARKEHKLQEWRDMCAWIETLPYSELITGKTE